MNELKKMKDLFDDFIKEADKFVSKQRVKQTQEELMQAYEDKVEGFSTGGYWSYTPYNHYAYYGIFGDCYSSYYIGTNNACSVRCVYDK